MNPNKFLFFFLLVNAPLCGGWLERKAEGWCWYEEEKEAAEEIIEINEQESAAEQLESFKNKNELLFAEAVLNPTQENMIKYMEAQKALIERSASFSKSWEKILLVRPDLDPTATSFATSHYGRQLQKSIEREEKEELIKEISKRYGLLFFYEGSNKASQSFANVVKTLSKKYHWTVVGVSMDGVPLPEIGTNADLQLAKKIGVNIFPSLFAFEPGERIAVPLSFGLKSLDQIENNVFFQFNTKD